MQTVCNIERNSKQIIFLTSPTAPFGHGNKKAHTTGIKMPDSSSQNSALLCFEKRRNNKTGHSPEASSAQCEINADASTINAITHTPSTVSNLIMKNKQFALAIVGVLTLIGNVMGQEVSPKKTRSQQLGSAYGYVVGQQYSLKSIESKFPELGTGLAEANFAFNSSALGGGHKGVETELQAELGDKWPEYKATVITQLKESISKRVITSDQASAFLTEVKSRSKGKVQEEIRSTLLSANPRYCENPVLEMSEGWKQTFRTKDHPKAKGVDFSLSFPISWAKSEGNRPNIIQNFRSGAGYGPVMSNLLVKTLPFPQDYKITPEDLKEFFLPSVLKGMIAEDAKLIEAKTIVLDGRPAGMIVSDVTGQRLDFSISMRTTQFITIQDHSMITFQFMISTPPDSKETLDAMQKRNLPVFLSIANTFVFNDKYK